MTNYLEANRDDSDAGITLELEREQVFQSLSPFLRDEEYPYELGIIRGFAIAIVTGETAPMIEAFRMSSAGQGINSKASYSQAISELQETPGLIAVIGGEIPFPTRVSLPEGGSGIEVQYITIKEALERVSNFS